MSASATTDFLVAKARSAELELQNAHLKDEMQTLKQEKLELEEQLRAQTQRFANHQSTQFQDELFASQKEVRRLTDHKASLEQQLEKANETIQALHKNIAREVQRAKDEVERQSIFLRSQILEQKEINTALQEKLMTAMQFSKQLEDEGLHDHVTETILITSDAVLQKMRQEHRHSVKGKYDVSVDISGRNMVLSGRKVNVQLLKAEVLATLNEAYCALVDPSKYISAARAKEEAVRHESEHLRRTVLTHEATIQSLHLALQHAQARSDAAVSSTEASTRQQAVAEAKLAEQGRHHAAEAADLRRQIENLQHALQDQEETNAMALASLKSESHVSAQYRAEIEQLRDTIRRLTETKELAERSVYVTSQQLEMTRQQLQDAIRSDVQLAEVRRQLDEAEHRAGTADQRVATARREAKDHAERLMVEIGTLQERLRHSSEEVARAKKDLQTATLERDTARAELQQSRDVIMEMRSKMVHLSVMSMENPKSSTGREGSARGTGGYDTPNGLQSGTERQRSRLEEENIALRTELQHAFEDMRAVATSLSETKLVRERALEDVARLEMEKGKLFEERQRLERQSVEERMASRQRESELELQVLALRDELQHQQKRVDMLHAEYQKKIQDFIQETNARFAAESMSPTAAQLDDANARLRGHTHPYPQRKPLQRVPSAAVELPNDPSQAPSRTPKSATKLSDAGRPQSGTPGAAGIYTLRSSSNDPQNASGLVSTPRSLQGATGTTGGFRLSATKPVTADALDSPPR